MHRWTPPMDGDGTAMSLATNCLPWLPARNSNYFHFQLFPLGVPSNQLFTLVTGAKFKLLSLSKLYFPTKKPIFLLSHQAPDVFIFLLDLSREAALRRWYSAT